MLFIIAMDVLSRLVAKAEELRLLEPLARRSIEHRMLIYADDVVIFTSAKTEDLSLIKSLLGKFANSWGLRANMVKSSIVPICCAEEDVELASQHLDCQIASFPCKYLGLPLSIRKLTNIDLQPILYRVADALPEWKAALMVRSGRLIMVKAALTAIPVYLLIALDAPKWFLKTVDKWRRQFLWRGRQDLKGGHYPVAWKRMTRHLNLGGLGIHDLHTMAWALRMCWLWLEKTNLDRPWALLSVNVPGPVKAMFSISVTTSVGDSSTTIF